VSRTDLLAPLQLRDNFWKTGLSIVKKVVGAENAGSFA
jgi:hypothetical protein